MLLAGIAFVHQRLRIEASVGRLTRSGSLLTWLS